MYYDHIMYNLKYNIINTIHPKVKHNKTMEYFDYLGPFRDSLLLVYY